MKEHEETIKNLNLKTGDVVLFSGRCRVARTIQILTLCKWSHIGMIIDDPVHGICSYESTHNDRWAGLDIGRKTQGVQIVPLAKRFEGYKGDIAIQRLVDVDITQYDLDRLNKFRKDSVGIPFEKYYFDAFLSMFKWIEKKSSLDFRFCSEHHGAAQVALGVLESSYPVHKITPADYAYRRVKLRKGSLGKPFVVRKYNK